MWQLLNNQKLKVMKIRLGISGTSPTSKHHGEEKNV